MTEWFLLMIDWIVLINVTCLGISIYYDTHTRILNQNIERFNSTNHNKKIQVRSNIARHKKIYSNIIETVDNKPSFETKIDDFVPLLQSKILKFKFIRDKSTKKVLKFYLVLF